MHKQVIFVHISLDERLVLLGVPTANHKVVLACDKPDEFLEPKDFALGGAILRLLELLKVASGGLLSLLDGRLSRVDRLDLLLVRLLPNLEVLLNVELRRDPQVDIDSHDLVEVAKVVVIDLHGGLVGLIHSVEDERNLIFFEVYLVDQVGELIVLLALLLDHSLDIAPRDTRADHHRQDVDDCLRFECVFLQQKRLEI